MEILDEAARQCSVPFRARPALRGRAVRFRHMDRYFGAVNVMRTTLDNFHGVRSASLARRDPEPRVILTLASSRYTIEQNGRVNSRPSMSMVPYWSRDAVKLRSEESTRAWSITMTVEELGLPYLLLRDLLVRDVGRSPLGRMVTRYLIDLAALPELSQAQAGALAHPTIDLIRALLTTASGDDLLSRQPLSRTLGMRIMLYLRNHVADPDLSADLLANRFDISKRYLYTVLAGMDVTLGEWIRTERLNRAARSLANPANALVSIAAVAKMSGFPDHSSFSRAFKQRYGCTPTEWRLLDDAGRAEPPAGHHPRS